MLSTIIWADIYTQIFATALIFFLAYHLYTQGMSEPIIIPILLIAMFIAIWIFFRMDVSQEFCGILPVEAKIIAAIYLAPVSF